MPNRPLLFLITSKDVPVTRWDLYPWSPASSRHCRGCYWIWFRHASSLQAPGPKPREISWGDQLDSQLSVFFAYLFWAHWKRICCFQKGMAFRFMLFCLFICSCWKFESLHRQSTDTCSCFSTQMQNTWHRCNKIELFPCGLNANSQWIRTRWCPGSLAKLANITPITN